MKIITVLGTRPEITKLSPLLPELDEHFEHKIIHTGQHYDYNMDKVFFEQLKLRSPDYQLTIGANNLGHAQQTGQMMIEIEKILIHEKPDWFLVFADTNTPLAGALAAAKLNIPLIHMEAGCRSFNKQMPEEINRIVCDHCADLLLAPDLVARENLLREGLDEKIIHVVGSTAILAARRNAIIAENTVSILDDLELKKKDYLLLTLHRAENTNDIDRLRGIIEAVDAISHKKLVVWPLHPRTKKIIEDQNFFISPRVRITAPLDYLNFLMLLKNAYFVMSDSGGIQEEAAALDTPCIILRSETEWTYLLDLGKNLLIGVNKNTIINKISELMASPDKIDKMARVPLHRPESVAKNIIEVIQNVTNSAHVKK